MEFRQIRSFLSVAETPHFGRTAELIHFSQPALSKTTLTATGFAFRDDAAAAMSQLEEAIRRARLAADGKLGYCGLASSQLLEERSCPLSFVSLEN
jgi:DNA-binding transcriptional LysR family regulator